MLKALKIKGLTVVDSEKVKAGHYVVRVKSDDKKIIAKANSVAIKAMSEWVEEVNPITEALSKKLSSLEVKKVANKYQITDPDEIASLKNEYSPKKTPRPKAWLSLAYPVRDGDYYFAFVSDDEKKNTKFNSKLNDVMREVGRGRIVGGINKAVDLADEIWKAVSKEVKKYPRDLGWNDTMTREEIWASIAHMIAVPGFKEEIEEVAIGKMRIGKRKKAPKWS